MEGRITSVLDVQMLWIRWQVLLRVRAVGKEFVVLKISMRSSAGRAGSVMVECRVSVAMLGIVGSVFICGCKLMMVVGLAC